MANLPPPPPGPPTPMDSAASAAAVPQRADPQDGEKKAAACPNGEDDDGAASNVSQHSAATVVPEHIAESTDAEAAAPSIAEQKRARGVEEEAAEEAVVEPADAAGDEAEVLRIRFPQAPWPAPEGFEAKLLDGLLALGAASVEDLKVNLCEGGVVAEISGPPPALAMLRHLLLDSLVVLGYSVGEAVWSGGAAGDDTAVVARRPEEGATKAAEEPQGKRPDESATDADAATDAGGAATEGALTHAATRGGAATEGGGAATEGALTRGGAVTEPPAVYCVCGNVFMPDAVFCRKCGARRPAQGSALAQKRPRSQSPPQSLPSRCSPSRLGAAGDGSADGAFVGEVAPRLTAAAVKAAAASAAAKLFADAGSEAPAGAPSELPRSEVGGVARTGGGQSELQRTEFPRSELVAGSDQPRSQCARSEFLVGRSVIRNMSISPISSPGIRIKRKRKKKKDQPVGQESRLRSRSPRKHRRKDPRRRPHGEVRSLSPQRPVALSPSHWEARRSLSAGETPVPQRGTRDPSRFGDDYNRFDADPSHAVSRGTSSSHWMPTPSVAPEAPDADGSAGPKSIVLTPAPGTVAAGEKRRAKKLADDAPSECSPCSGDDDARDQRMQGASAKQKARQKKRTADGAGASGSEAPDHPIKAARGKAAAVPRKRGARDHEGGKPRKRSAEREEKRRRKEAKKHARSRSRARLRM